MLGVRVFFAMSVKTGSNPTYSMGGKGGKFNVISARALKLIDRVWYNAID